MNSDTFARVLKISHFGAVRIYKQTVIYTINQLIMDDYA